MKNKEIQYYIISDTHLSHKKMIVHGRPENFEDLIKQSVIDIPLYSVTIHIGDICIGNDKENNCFFYHNTGLKTILVKGNHDNKSDTFYNNYWGMVCEEFVLEHRGKRILFSHEPKQKRDGIDLNIHGHLHTMEREDRLKEYPWYDESYHKLVSMEYQSYKPINLNDLIK